MYQFSHITSLSTSCLPIKVSHLLFINDSCCSLVCWYGSKFSSIRGYWASIRFLKNSKTWQAERISTVYSKHAWNCSWLLFLNHWMCVNKRMWRKLGTDLLVECIFKTCKLCHSCGFAVSHIIHLEAFYTLVLKQSVNINFNTAQGTHLFLYFTQSQTMGRKRCSLTMIMISICKMITLRTHRESVFDHFFQDLQFARCNFLTVDKVLLMFFRNFAQEGRISQHEQSCQWKELNVRL